MRARARIAVAVWIGVAALGAASAGAHVVGLRFNDTASAPLGLWRINMEDRTPKRGALVAVCPPEVSVVKAMASGGHLPPGRCPVGSSTLLKPVAAIGGDTVTVTLNGVAVNGFLLPNTVAHPDVLGFRPVGLGRYQVKPDQVWLLSSYSPESFDSRYFGPVAARSIEGTATPVLVMGDTTTVYGGL